MAQTLTGKYFDELEVGFTVTVGPRIITEQDVMGFARMTGDHNPLHVDPEFASRTMFKKQIAHGMLTASIATGMVASSGIFHGTVIAFLQSDSKFKAPVYFGDAITALTTILEKKDSQRPTRGVVVFNSIVRNQDGVEVVDCTWSIMMKKRNLQ